MSDEDRSQVLQALVDAIPKGTPNELREALGGCADSDSEVIVAAALAAVASIEPGGPKPPPDKYRVPLDVLAASPHPLAGAALVNLAKNARNDRIKAEAMARLHSALTNRSREYLRQVAGGDFQLNRSFQQDEVTATQMREAAVRALGRLSDPRDEDIKAVIEVVKGEAAQGGQSSLFRTGVQALDSISRPTDVEAILGIVSSCRRADIRTQLLAVCSKFDKEELGAQRGDLAEQLAQALKEPAKLGKAVRERLCALARDVSCAALVKSLPASETLGKGGGEVCAAALDAYGKTDEILTSAYLRFAREVANIRTGSPCISGLARCAHAGYRDRIAHAVVKQAREEGYHQMLTTGLLAEALGGVAALVRGLSAALSELEEPLDMKLIENCATCVVGASLQGSERGLHFGSLSQAGRDAQTVQELLAALGELDEEGNGLSIVARACLSAEHGDGTSLLARHFLSEGSCVAEYFGGLLLRRACTLRLEDSGDTDDRLPLRQVEQELLAREAGWEEVKLADFAVVDGHMNRYVIDLMRRTEQDGFAAACQSTLGAVSCAEEADFVLKCLAAMQTAKSHKVLAWAARCEVAERSLVLHVREQALTQIAGLAQELRGSVNEAVRAELVSAVHGAFSSTKRVRAAAYDAAAAIADLSSIQPLRTRLNEETDGDLRNSVRGALEAIGERLRAEKPPSTESERVRAWLENVARSADDRFLDGVLQYLSPPHADAEVRIAALQCAAELGEPRAIEAIERFVGETAPSAEEKRAARRAIAALEGRQDLGLLDVLGELLPTESPALEFDKDYVELLGGARVVRVTRCLRDCAEQLRAGHWGDFVTRLDGVCDVLVRHLFENHWGAMGLSQDKGEQMARQGYASRLKMTEFGRTYPELQSLLQEINRMRNEATTAHVEDREGKGKPGLSETEAQFALNQFREAFRRYVAALSRHCSGDTEDGRADS